jgi:DnaJ-class molecular chaperone
VLTSNYNAMAEEDYYAILGVDRQADATTIKKVNE